MKIRAAVAEKSVYGDPSNTVTIQELELDDSLREKEVLVRVVACAVCHADLAARDGHLPFPLPGVLGHEGTGVIERVSAKVDRVKAGDHVLMTFPNDGTCENCLDGKPRWCKHSGDLTWSGRRYDGSPTALSRNGEPVSGHLFQQSAFATHVIATEMNVVPVSQEVLLEQFVLGCGIMTGAGGVLNSLKPAPGSSIVIFGAGGVGSAAIMAAKIGGCKTIIAVEPRENRRETALEIGATHALDSGDSHLVQRIKNLTGGGAHFALICVGNAEAIGLGVEALRIGGVFGVIGDPGIGAMGSFSIPGVVGGSKTIRGINGGDSIAPTFLPALIEAHGRGLLPLEKVTKSYSLDDLNSAFLDAEEGRVIKPVIVIGSV
jgi:aryl-alcohol dehydrogenase